MTTKAKQWSPLTSKGGPPTVADMGTVEKLPGSIADPCPFCGHHPGVQSWHGGPPSKRMVGCQNDECHIAPSAVGDTLKEALAIWNQRA